MLSSTSQCSDEGVQCGDSENSRPHRLQRNLPSCPVWVERRYQSGAPRVQRPVVGTRGSIRAGGRDGGGPCDIHTCARAVLAPVFGARCVPWDPDTRLHSRPATAGAFRSILCMGGGMNLRGVPPSFVRGRGAPAVATTTPLLRKAGRYG